MRCDENFDRPSPAECELGGGGGVTGGHGRVTGGFGKGTETICGLVGTLGTGAMAFWAPLHRCQCLKSAKRAWI